MAMATTSPPDRRMTAPEYLAWERAQPERHDF
jgi:hypothetical protein